MGTETAYGACNGSYSGVFPTCSCHQTIGTAALSLYDPGVIASYGDELLVLVPCAYRTESGQLGWWPNIAPGRFHDDNGE